MNSPNTVRALFLYLSSHRWPALLWTFLIVVACTWPAEDLPEAPTLGFDKLVHVALYAGWIGLWLMLYPRRLLLLLAMGIIFGIGMEFYQEWLPFGRSFDWWDALANTLGALIGGAVFRLLSRLGLLSS